MLKKNILQGNYTEARMLCENIDFEILRKKIFDIIYDTDSIAIYVFVQYMIEFTRDIKWIELAIEIMIHPLCFIEGAYSVALYHSRELLRIDRNVVNLERILFFYNIPEKLVDIEEAKSISKEILLLEKNNEIALEILNK